MASTNGLSTSKPLLIAFAGLPGTGKSTVALGLAGTLGALYLRVDTIEQAIRNSPGVSQAINEEGYRVAYAVAKDNLGLGRHVISDAVNPVQETRDAWQETAHSANAILVEVEVICSDAAAHRLRVETRNVSIPGLKLPTWEEVLLHAYQPWERDHIVIDTAYKAVSESVAELHAAIVVRVDALYP